MMTAFSLSSAIRPPPCLWLPTPINTPGKQPFFPPLPPPPEITGEMKLYVLSVHHGWKVNLTEHGPLDKQSIQGRDRIAALSGGARKAPDVLQKPKANYPDMDETIANWTNDII